LGIQKTTFTTLPLLPILQLFGQPSPGTREPDPTTQGKAAPKVVKEVKVVKVVF
jgi:hypothetical protein